MPVFCENIGVAYFSIPKCACSSLKAYFHEVGTGRSWRQEKEAGATDTLHERYPSVPFSDIVWDDYAGFKTLTVVREPVARLLSCYNNKVLLGEDTEGPRATALLTAQGLPIKPTFDVFVDNLDAYRAASKMVKSHSETLEFWLGPDPDRFDRVFDIGDMKTIRNLVKRRGGPSVAVDRKNKTRGGMKAGEMTDATRGKIMARYASDYEIFGHVFGGKAAHDSKNAARA